MTHVHSSLLWRSAIHHDICDINDVDFYDGSDGDLNDMHELDELEFIDELSGLSGDDDICRKARKERWLHIRLCWALHSKKLVHEGEFERTYGMSLDSFNGLVTILDPMVRRHTNMSRSPQPISVELIVATSMRYLRGGCVNDLKNVYGLSRTEVYCCRDSFLHGVLKCETLDISLPKSAEEWEKVRQGFQSKSTDQFIDGCVGALDGFLQKTICPRKKEVGGAVEGYRSGHYLCFGLNCQALVDASLKFRFFGVVAPGSTNDSAAIQRAEGLLEIINSLPKGLFVVGDAAYALSEHLLIPFIGCQSEVIEHDVYNFYISQLRIRVEMAFGLFVKKFGILRSAMQTSVKTTTKILVVCARLHNFLIDRHIIENEGENIDHLYHDNFSNRTSVRDAPDGMQYLPTIPNAFEEIDGYSQIRHTIIEKIREKNIRRPLHNIVRNEPRKERVNNEGIFDGIPTMFYAPR